MEQSFHYAAIALHPLTTLGFRLFREPLLLDRYWILMLLPLVVAISIVYKTLKVHTLSQLPRQVAILVTQILVFMVLVASALWLVSELF
jgi:hypothetical protein